MILLSRRLPSSTTQAELKEIVETLLTDLGISIKTANMLTPVLTSTCEKMGLLQSSYLTSEND